MGKKTRLIVLFSLLFIVFAFVAPYLAIQKFGNIEELQNYIQSLGTLGWLVFFLLGVVSTVILPLNYSIVALAGGFLYGTFPAFLLLWASRSTGAFINFVLGKKLGRNVLKVFVAEEKLEGYDALLHSEKVAQLYFILCFLPFMPSDYGGYVLGCSKMKKSTFLLLTTLGNIGSCFSLAYMGSGQAFTDPLFLSIFSVLFLSGIAWIHKQKKKLQLQ